MHREEPGKRPRRCSVMTNVCIFGAAVLCALLVQSPVADGFAPLPRPHQLAIRTTLRIETTGTGLDVKTDARKSVGRRHQQRRRVEPSSSKPVPKPPQNPAVKARQAPAASQAWKASYHVSYKTQQRIKHAATASKTLANIDRSTLILDTFLHCDPTRCNPANVVCALTLSAKHLQSAAPKNSNVAYHRQRFFAVIDVLQALVADRALSARQLCNSVWAIAKHYDHDEQVMSDSSNGDSLSAAITTNFVDDGTEAWPVKDHDGAAITTPQCVVHATVDEIAQCLAEQLDENVYAAKEWELSMAAWAYGVLRQRQKPPGWKLRPRMGQVPHQQSAVHRGNDTTWNLMYRQDHVWNTNSAADEVECTSLDPPSATDVLFDRVAISLCASATIGVNGYDDNIITSTRLQCCQWKELASIAWAYAHHGYVCSEASRTMLQALATETAGRLRNDRHYGNTPLSRDLAQIVWALGTLQADSFYLTDSLMDVVDALSQRLFHHQRTEHALQEWSSADVVQVALALAHARLDEKELLCALYQEAAARIRAFLSLSAQSRAPPPFLAWEISILFWSQARLYLTKNQSDAHADFITEATRYIEVLRHGNHGSLVEIGLGEKEQANLAWSLTVLEAEKAESGRALLQAIFEAAAVECQASCSIQLEHAHQLWQSYTLLAESAPATVADVPTWFCDCLRDKWLLEKSRAKLSSARHKALSQTLDLMGIEHANEHDEDIDVAIVLRPQAVWTHETDDRQKRNSTMNSSERGMRLAIEFDGPKHFTRVPASSSSSAPRALGHTVLKYRLLKQQGWTVVRVPYYEFDKIPFWASMERQRYLQRLLKTHGLLQFSGVDRSEYRPLIGTRTTRFD